MLSKCYHLREYFAECTDIYYSYDSDNNIHHNDILGCVSDNVNKIYIVVTNIGHRSKDGYAAIQTIHTRTYPSDYEICYYDTGFSHVIDVKYL